ncbi:unnamed protein product [Calypogeia fissa]
MRSLDRPSFKFKRTGSPLREADGNITVGSRSKQHKKAKFKLEFKSPLPTAHPTISENSVASSIVRDDCGTDGSNMQPRFESRIRVHTAHERSQRPYHAQSNAMPGFGGILEDIYEICPEADVKIEAPDDESYREMKTSLLPKFQKSEAEDTATQKVQPLRSTLEGSFDAGIDRRTDIQRLRANAFGSTAATNRSSIFSKFKMPAQVRSACENWDVLAITPNAPVTLVRSHRLHQPNRSLTMPVSHSKANENRSTLEQKIASDYYCVMFCIRKPNAKHKGPWSDGVLIRQGRVSILHDAEGKLVLKNIEQRVGALSEGDTLLMGKYEVEVMRTSTEEEFLSGKIFQGTEESPSEEVVKVVQRRPFKSFQVPPVKHARVSTDKDKVPPCKLQAPKVKPALEKNALVLNAEDLQRGCSPVFVDPYLASKLRPHQREGVQFMYECVMGTRNPLFTGCLLADAMGLGKTLQVIALIWTLIKKGPGGHPAVRKVLVICPSSLVENWGKEVRKWLGNERLPPLVIHSGTPAKDVKRKISNFQVGTVYHLLITSYELVRKHADDFNAAKPELLVCDEAHRLKNCAGNKTIDSLLELKCTKRLILTGTPIQNDLLEFYAMIDFVNPNLLGNLSTFKRLYANPIEKSRDRDASEVEQLLGRARSAELQSMTSFCILQRAANVNAKYLPDKTEYVVFCMLQNSQCSLYQDFLKSKLVSDSLASGQPAFVLSAIGTLRKLCNHPMLVEHEISTGNVNLCGVSSKNEDGLKAVFGQAKRSQNRMSADWRLSGKLCCLQRLLSAIHSSTTSEIKDKMVVVSNFTQTLDIIQIMCEGQGWRWLRLDGATNVSERQALVDRFNANGSDSTVFLLSSKAGGAGLNLVGANRLVLFDPDWNPATDAQAMARIWRDGQKKSVFIYRLLTTASIEEKIYQRQIMKGEVAAALEQRVQRHSPDGDGGGRRHFSREELRELFNLNLETSCDTYDLLSRSEASSSERWRDCSNEVEDHALKEAICTGVVTYVHQKTYAKESFSSVDNVPNVEESKAEDHTGVVDTHQPQLSSFVSDVSFNELDDLPQDCEQIADPQKDIECKLITRLDYERPPTRSTTTTLLKEEKVGEDRDATIGLSSVAPDVFLNKVVDQKSECNEQISSPICRERSDIDIEDGPLADEKLSRALSKIETNIAEKDGSSDANSVDKSPMAIHGAEEFNCLLESRSQKILKLMLNLPVPDDEFDEQELEDLDAPFLCSLDLEIEMKKATFVPEDLWQGFKLFAMGFLLKEKEEVQAYRNSKLGQILHKCNPDKIADDESLFCKAFPMIRAVLSKRDEHRAADLSHLFSKFEREEHLKTTVGGR